MGLSACRGGGWLSACQGGCLPARGVQCKMLGYHASCQEVSRCRTRGESEESIACRRGNVHSGFDTRGRHHQKSQTGVPVAPQIELMSSKKII